MLPILSRATVTWSVRFLTLSSPLLSTTQLHGLFLSLLTPNLPHVLCEVRLCGSDRQWLELPTSCWS